MMLSFYLSSFNQKNYLGNLDKAQIELILKSEYTLGAYAISFIDSCLSNHQHTIDSTTVNKLIESIGQTFLPLKIVHGPPKEVLYLDKFLYEASQKKCPLCILNKSIG